MPVSTEVIEAGSSPLVESALATGGIPQRQGRSAEQLRFSEEEPLAPELVRYSAG